MIAETVANPSPCFVDFPILDVDVDEHVDVDVDVDVDIDVDVLQSLAEVANAAAIDLVRGVAQGSDVEPG